jgi:hypothetical protein
MSLLHVPGVQMSVIIVAPEEEWAEIGAYFGALCEDSNGPVASYFLLWTRVQLTRADVCPLRYDLVRAEAELLRLIGQGSSLAEEGALLSVPWVNQLGYDVPSRAIFDAQPPHDGEPPFSTKC